MGSPSVPGVLGQEAPVETTDSDGSTHAFELVFDNIMKSWRAWCSCGEKFGLSGYVGTLGDEFDDHCDAVGVSWWRL